MMKKISAVLIFVGLSSVSGVAGAAAITGGAAVETSACSLLSDRVTINLSTGVNAAYNCDTTNNVIRVGACHTSGSQKPTSIACVGTDDGSGNLVYNNSACDGTPGQTFQIQGRRVYTGRSTGGGVAGGSLDSETCDTAAVETKIAN